MIDLDQNATTPIDPAVLEAMRPYFLAGGNPESRHGLGRAARRGLDRARETVAALLNAQPSEVVFTSGGTESNNLAIFGLAGLERGPGHVLTSPIEHPAVAEPVDRLAALGFEVDRPAVGSDGIMDADRMAEAIRFDTRFVSLMLANNETGAIQPAARVAALAGERGLPTHTDAVQAVGRVPVDFQALGVAALSASAHKFHGPAGVGLLLLKRGTTLKPLTFGGSQQSGRRPGTPPVALAVGLAVALELRVKSLEATSGRQRALGDRLETLLAEKLGASCVLRNGPTADADRLPQTLNLGFPGIDGDALLMQLDLGGVAVSIGSACSSGSTKPSPTLLAMGIPSDRIRSSVRVSFGAFTTETEIDDAAERIAAAVDRIRSASA